MPSNSLDPLAVHQRTAELAEEACALVKAKMLADPSFSCRIEQADPSNIVQQIWSACYRRAIEEALAQDDDATRH